MKPIPLGRNKKHTAWVDDSDYERLSQFAWSYSGKGYAVRREGTRYKGTSRMIWMHREILKCPEGMVVDHINRDRLRNTRDNLRVCTRTENQRNVGKKSHNTSGYKGVVWSQAAKKWIAQIGVNGEHHYLGLFDDPLVAAKVYKAAEVWFFGQFAPPSSTPGSLNDCIRLWIQAERDTKRKKKESGYRGVIWDTEKHKWLASITKDHKQRFLGYCKHIVLAAAAYNEAAIVLYGSDARLNEIKEADLVDYAVWKNSSESSDLRTTNTSGYEGVSWFRPTQVWRSFIQYDSNQLYLGQFQSKEEAAYIRDQVNLQLFGDDTRLNILDKDYDPANGL